MIIDRHRWYGKKRVVFRAKDTQEGLDFIKSELRMEVSTGQTHVKAFIRPVDGMYRSAIDFKINRTQYYVYIK
jgi:hypothetical protein